MPHTTKEQLKEFLDLARKRLDECGNENEIGMTYGGMKGIPSKCVGCPAYGSYGGEYIDCAYSAAIEMVVEDEKGACGIALDRGY